MEKIKYVLASASPRRQELFKFICDKFEIITSDVEEKSDFKVFLEQFSADETAEMSAVQKALDVKMQLEGEFLVIACDTVVICEGKILGKPKSRENAKEMLRFLSGKTHQVVTGVCIASAKRTMSFSQKTDVVFYELKDEEIDKYLMIDEYKDKAGSYAVQGFASLFVKEIRGDYFNIVGLPISLLNKKIAEFLLLK